ncbi:MAG: hypothetical protein Q9188_002082 [Gyalolechia gomerana]
MAPQPTEADILFNRANVALAKSQRLVASWLPPRTEEEIKNARTEEEIEKEEQELFTPVPELLGLGAKPPEDVKDGDLKRQKLTSNDVLRRQLLGKDHARLYSKHHQRPGEQRGTTGILPAGSKPQHASTIRKLEEESSGDEGGRSSLGNRKHGRLDVNEGQKEVETVSTYQRQRQNERQQSLKHTRATGNYLDEVLSRKEKKHKKKKMADHASKAKA